MSDPTPPHASPADAPPLRAGLLRRPPTSADAAGILVITTLLTTAVWLDLDHVLAFAVAGIVALVAAIYLPVPAAVDAEPGPALTRGGLVRSLPIAAVILLPMVIALATRWHEEFPWSGDCFYHLYASHSVRVFWIKRALLVVIFVAVTFGLRRLGFRYWAPLALAVMVAWAFRGTAPHSAARYPASGYFLEVPLRLITHFSTLGDPPLLLDRLSMAASALVWLFVLRPLALRRWPDVGVLPFGVFYFWQKDIVHYMTNVYLEPWAVVLVLVAVELSLSKRPTRTWLPALLIGAAACVKEPALLVLPWIGLASALALPRTLRAWVALAVHGVLAALPFLIYLRFRVASGIDRNFEMAPSSALWSSSRLHELWYRAQVEFGTGGLVLLALSVVATLALAVRYRERRVLAVLLLGAVASQFVFFYVDSASLPWTGYSRFYMFGLAVLGMAAWSAPAALRAARRFGRLAIAAAVLAGALLAPTLGGYLALLLGPDPGLNSFENAETPIYFPIRALVQEAAAAGAITRGTVITVKEPATAFAVVGDIYANLGKRYTFNIVAATSCRCTPEHSALLLPIIYPSGLRSAPGALPLPDDAIACRAAMQATYQRLFERTLDGYPTGVLGVGCVPSPAVPVSPSAGGTPVAP